MDKFLGAVRKFRRDIAQNRPTPRPAPTPDRIISRPSVRPPPPPSAPPLMELESIPPNSEPSTSTAAISYEHRFLSGKEIPQLMPPPPKFYRGFVNFEMDVFISVTTNMEVKSVEKLMDPLINVHIDYIGELTYKQFWITLLLFGSFKLVQHSKGKDYWIYRSKICRGARLDYESLKPFELGRKMSWCQNFKYLSDGLKSEWTVKCDTMSTNVMYPKKKGTQSMVDYLNAMGIHCKLENDQWVIFNPIC